MVTKYLVKVKFMIDNNFFRNHDHNQTLKL